LSCLTNEVSTTEVDSDKGDTTKHGVKDNEQECHYALSVGLLPFHPDKKNYIMGAELCIKHHKRPEEATLV
jgi:hypothetical protein